MSSLPRKVGKRSRYSESFKRDAVRLSAEHSVKVAAEELGLSASMLSKWRKLYLTSAQSSSDKSRSYADLARENAKLKEENSMLEDINSVLKKTADILAQAGVQNNIK